MQFYQNFIRLCNGVKKSPSAVAMELGFSRTAVSGWKNGSVPSDSKIFAIADYFGVSVKELVEENNDKKIEPQIEVLDKEQKVLFADYCKLTIDEQKLVADIIRRLKNGTLGQ